MKTRVENYLPPAIKAVEKIILEGKTGKPVPRPFKGYISAFGAAVIQSGILPAVAFYSAKGGAEEDRTNVIRAIEYILNRQENFQYNDNETLLKYLVEHPAERENLTAKIMDAATALKLALRTFEIEK